MSTDFAREHKTPGGRFRPGPGMVGTKAGLQAGRQAGGAARPPRPSPPDSKRGGGLGLPQMQQPEKAPDYRHIVALTQHQNMTDLGRDQPFGIHAINNGDFRQMFEPGRMPYDWFLDT